MNLIAVIPGAFLVLAWTCFLVYYIYTWVKDNGRSVRWNLGRILIALFFIAVGALDIILFG